MSTGFKVIRKFIVCRKLTQKKLVLDCCSAHLISVPYLKAWMFTTTAWHDQMFIFISVWTNNFWKTIYLHLDFSVVNGVLNSEAIYVNKSLQNDLTTTRNGIDQHFGSISKLPSSPTSLTAFSTNNRLKFIVILSSHLFLFAKFYECRK